MLLGGRHHHDRRAVSHRVPAPGSTTNALGKLTACTNCKSANAIREHHSSSIVDPRPLTLPCRSQTPATCSSTSGVTCGTADGKQCGPEHLFGAGSRRAGDLTIVGATGQPNAKGADRISWRWSPDGAGFHPNMQYLPLRALRGYLRAGRTPGIGEDDVDDLLRNGSRTYTRWHARYRGHRLVQLEGAGAAVLDAATPGDVTTACRLGIVTPGARYW